MCFHQLIVGFVLLGAVMEVSADIVVVVHPESPVKHLTARAVSDLYLGRKVTVGDGEPLLVLDQPGDSPLRERFFRRLNGMDPRRVNAYWARLQFSGDVQPPTPLTGSQAVLDVVRRNPRAIGYVDASEVGAADHIVLLLKE